MRDEPDRRKAIDSKREIFRNMLAGMDEKQLIELEQAITKQIDTITDLIKKGEDEICHKIELLSDIDDRLQYLERFNFKNITKVAKELEDS